MSTEAPNTTTIFERVKATSVETTPVETTRLARCRAEVAMESSHGTTERQRAAAYPIGRWYVRPAAGWLAHRLAPTRVRPNHLSICGLIAALGAAIVVTWHGEVPLAAALLVLLYWFFDRADGQLARCQETVSRWGAWLDGNIDELVDLGLHTAMAAALASQTDSPWPWWLLIGFISGKYLFMYGLALEEHAGSPEGKSRRVAGVERSEPPGNSLLWGRCAGPQPPNVHFRTKPSASRHRPPLAWLRRIYHLPGNADVRIHLLIAALATGWWAIELAGIAAYYNLRWMVRYRLVARRLGGMS